MALLVARGLVVDLWGKRSPLKQGFAASTAREEHTAVSPGGSWKEGHKAGFPEKVLQNVSGKKVRFAH